MTEADRVQIKRLWESRLSIEQIVQMLPYRQNEVRAMIAELRADGTLKPRKKTEMARAKIAEAYKGGMTDIAEICAVFGYSKNTINKYLLDEGVKRGRPKHHKPKGVNEKAKEIMREIARGKKSLTEIANVFSVSRQYVHQLKTRLEQSKSQ